METKQGQIVTLKHYTGKEFSQGIVLKTNENIVTVKPSKECAVFSYFTNDPLVLGIIKENELMMCECTITNINYNENHVDLKIEKSYHIEEKRTTERFPTSVYGVIVRSQVKGAVYIKNISRTGLAIKSKADFNEGDEIEIEAYINKVLLSVRSNIAWKKLVHGDFEYGLRIVNNDNKTQQIIMHYIDTLKQMQKDAINDLQQISNNSAAVIA